MLTALRELEKTEMKQPDAVRRILRLVQLGLQSLPQARVRDWLPELQKLGAATGLDREEVSELTQRLPEAIVNGRDLSPVEIDETPVDLSFSDADESLSEV